MPILLPDRCPRDRNDCRPLSQIVSDSRNDFICAGRNDGSTRNHPGDEFTLCVRSSATDTIEHVDRRDLIDQAAVILGALSAAENGA